MDSSFNRPDLFETVFYHASIGMALVSLEGKWLKVNQAVCNITGYSEKELLKIDFQSITHPDDLEDDLNHAKELLQGKCDSYQIDKRYFHKSGKIIWITLNGSIIRNPDDGSPKFFIAQIQDISQRKLLEIENKKLLERLNFALRASEKGVWDWHIKENHLILDDQMYKLYGVKAANFQGTVEAWSTCILQDDKERTQKEIELALEGKKRFDTEFRVLHPNGEIRHIRGIADVINDEEGNPARMLGINWDVTEERSLQKKIEEQQGKLVSSSRLASLGEIAGGIAHEINNPLAIIQANAIYGKRLLEKGHSHPEEFAKNFQVTIETVSRIADTIKGLRHFARDASEDPLHEASIEEIIESTLKLCSQTAYNKHIDIQIIPFNTDIRVNCRKHQIIQALYNILSNAFYAVRNCPKKWVRILVSDDNNNEVTIKVIDSGEGVINEIQDKIMDPFFTTKPVGIGSGLGLSIAVGVLHSHGGSLKFEPNSEYTTFTLTLPQVLNKQKSA